MNKFEDCIEKPTPENKLVAYSDGNFEYEVVLPEYVEENSMDYEQIIKIKENGRVVEKKKRVVFGNLQLEDIETTCVECHNGILRGRLARLIRKTKCHSKCRY